MSLSMSDALEFDNLDVVDAVLKTDDTFENALATATTNGIFNADKALLSLGNYGELPYGDIDASDAMVDESAFDLTDIVDLCIMEGGDSCEDCPIEDDEEVVGFDDDEDNDIIDEVISSTDSSDPDSSENVDDGNIIDSVEDDTADSTGYQVESGFDMFDSIFEGCGEEQNSITDMADPEDEPINEEDDEDYDDDEDDEDYDD